MRTRNGMKARFKCKLMPPNLGMNTTGYVQTICYIHVPYKFTPPLMLKIYIFHYANLLLFSPSTVPVPEEKL